MRHHTVASGEEHLALSTSTLATQGFRIVQSVQTRTTHPDCRFRLGGEGGVGFHLTEGGEGGLVIFSSD